MLRLDIPAGLTLDKSYQTTLTLDKPKAAPVVLDKAHQGLQKATQQFEGYFLHELLKEMRKTVPDDTLLPDDGNGKQIFQDMMDQTLSDNMSSRGDFGMAKMMYDQLSPALDKKVALTVNKKG